MYVMEGRKIPPVAWVPGSALATCAVHAWTVEVPPERQPRLLIHKVVKTSSAGSRELRVIGQIARQLLG